MLGADLPAKPYHDQRPMVLMTMTTIAPIDNTNPARAGRFTDSLLTLRADDDKTIPSTIDGVAASGPQTGTKANKRAKIPNVNPALLIIFDYKTNLGPFKFLGLSGCITFFYENNPDSTVSKCQLAGLG